MAVNFLKLSRMLLFYETRPDLERFIQAKDILSRLVPDLVVIFLSHIDREEEGSETRFS
jgi:hypothetical protein